MDDELRTTLSQLLTVVEATRADVKALDTKLSGRIDAVDAKLSGRIDAVEANLGARIDTVDAKLSGRIDAVEAKLSGRIDAVEANLGARIDDLTEQFVQHRHVTSANHFKLVGRIDQVASMLADHMADHDHDPADRKRA